MADGHIEELNEGAPVAARPAAAVILLRRGGKHRSGGLEVLLGRRTPHARFMASHAFACWPMYDGRSQCSSRLKYPYLV